MPLAMKVSQQHATCSALLYHCQVGVHFEGAVAYQTRPFTSSDAVTQSSRHGRGTCNGSRIYSSSLECISWSCDVGACWLEWRPLEELDELVKTLEEEEEEEEEEDELQCVYGAFSYESNPLRSLLRRCVPSMAFLELLSCQSQDNSCRLLGLQPLNRQRLGC